MHNFFFRQISLPPSARCERERKKKKKNLITIQREYTPTRYHNNTRPTRLRSVHRRRRRTRDPFDRVSTPSLSVSFAATNTFASEPSHGCVETISRSLRVVCNRTSFDGSTQKCNMRTRSFDVEMKKRFTIIINIYLYIRILLLSNTKNYKCSAKCTSCGSQNAVSRKTIS